MAIHCGDHWTPDEDLRLIELMNDGKSWVLISALLKRSRKSIEERVRHLKREATKRRSELRPHDRDWS
jgi:Myb-like DNA-binding domain